MPESKKIEAPNLSTQELIDVLISLSKTAKDIILANMPKGFDLVMELAKYHLAVTAIDFHSIVTKANEVYPDESKNSTAGTMEQNNPISGE